MRGHGLLAMFLIIFILSLFISFCATARCDADCRPRNAKLVQKYKRALGAQEKAAIEKEGAELPYAGNCKNSLIIMQ